MLGLIAVGVLVLRARRWPPPTRYLPLLASLLLPVHIALIWTPRAFQDVLVPVYIAVAYGLLGAMIARDAVRLAGCSAYPVKRNSTTSPSAEARG